MSRGQEKQLTVEPAAVQAEKPKPKPFEDLAHIPTFITNPGNPIGSESALTTPLHKPKAVAIYWAVDPKKDDNGDVYEAMQRGFRFARTDEVTNDVDKAQKDDIIGLRHYNIDVTNRIIVKNAVLMVASQAWVDKRLNDQYKKIDSDLSANAISERAGVEFAGATHNPTWERKTEVEEVPLIDNKE